jgi:mannose-6-phosphate isomerase-like protein (cupin superfamily)
MLVKIEKGLGIPEHIHEEQDDVLYTLSGRFKMWIDDVGKFEVWKNMMVRVPKKVKHKISEAYEDMVLHEIDKKAYGFNSGMSISLNTSA